MRFSLLALLVRFGGSHRTGQAAPPHRNKQSGEVIVTFTLSEGNSPSAHRRRYTLHLSKKALSVDTRARNNTLGVRTKNHAGVTAANREGLQ